MEFRDEYINSLIKCLELNDLNSAGELIRNFHRLSIKPDAACLYLESAYWYYSAKYALALYYADMCYLKDPAYEPVREIIGYLTGYEGDCRDYVPTFVNDVS